MFFKKRSWVVFVQLYTTYFKIAYVHYNINPTLTALLTPSLYVHLFLLTMIFTSNSLAFPSGHTAFKYPEWDDTSIESTVPTWFDPIPPPAATPVFVFTIALGKNGTNDNDAYSPRSDPLTVPSSNNHPKHPSNGTGNQYNRLNATLGCRPSPINITY